MDQSKSEQFLLCKLFGVTMHTHGVGKIVYSKHFVWRSVLLLNFESELQSH